MKTSVVYLVSYFDHARNGDYIYSAYKTKELARKEVQWYRENTLKPALDDWTAEELDELILTGDFVSEANYIHLVDTMTVQIEAIPYHGADT